MKAVKTAAIALCLIVVAAGAPGAAGASGYHRQILHRFNSSTRSSSPSYPAAGVILDAAGNLYGTTYTGGRKKVDGVVFKLARDGKLTILHDFTGNGDGSAPLGDLVFDQAGNLFGTTSGDGDGSGGTVFEIAAGGSYSVLHAFQLGGSDGVRPAAGVLDDQAGDVFGTTNVGGNDDYGVAFELAPDGTETILHQFLGGTGDGANPRSRLIADAAGNLYGTTVGGGLYACGVIFELAPNGAETILHNFGSTDSRGRPDGCSSFAGLIADAAGNMYGTTVFGGSRKSDGTVFKLAPDGTETVLYAFKRRADGALPVAALSLDSTGNLYGTAQSSGRGGAGTAFEIAAGGNFSLLTTFNAATSGDSPEDDLIMDTSGDLFGTTYLGGRKGGGAVFELSPRNGR